MLMSKTKNKEEARKKTWFLDSGCSNNMTGYKNVFLTLDLAFKYSVKLMNNKSMYVTGKRNIKLKFNDTPYMINDVYYVPELSLDNFKRSTYASSYHLRR